MEHINWYPGHMKKTRELIQENLKMVDIVIEVVDARIPVSSRNPIIDELISAKRRIMILNKSDLSDGRANDAWSEHFKNQDYDVLLMNCVTGYGVPQLLKLLTSIQEEKNAGKIRKKPLRMMIVGVPNVGKSSLINRLTGKKSAKTGNKPGVTRGKQWLNLENDMQLLDTPGDPLAEIRGSESRPGSCLLRIHQGRDPGCGVPCPGADQGAAGWLSRASERKIQAGGTGRAAAHYDGAYRGKEGFYPAGKTDRLREGRKDTAR